MLKVGLVGAGVMGRMHLNCYKQIPSVQVVAVADVRKKEGSEAASAAGAKHYRSLKAMLDAEDPDIVDVTLPTYLHKRAVLLAAERGKHILCEKPMAMTARQADQMIKAIEKNGVRFMVAQVIRFWPEYQVLIERTRSGELGKIQTAHFRRLGSVPRWSWDHWMEDPKRSGSAALDLHIHDVDFIQYLLGVPAAVTSVGSESALGWGHIATLYQYPDGPAVWVEGGWDMPEGYPFRMQFTVLFEQGAIEYDNHSSPTLMLYRSGEEPYPLDVPRPEAPSDAEVGGNISALGGYYNEIKYFVDCISQSRPIEVVTPRDARNAVAMVNAEVKSLKRGKRVTLKL